MAWSGKSLIDGGWRGVEEGGVLEKVVLRDPGSPGAIQGAYNTLKEVNPLGNALNEWQGLGGWRLDHVC